MSMVAYNGDVLGYGRCCCAPNPLTFLAGAGIAISVSGSTVTITNTGGVSNATLDELVLTALTGSGGLQDEVVDTSDIGTFRLAYDATYGVGTYRLRAGADEQSLPTIVRPFDHGAGDHLVVWEKVL